MENNGNIVLHQLHLGDGKFTIKELIPKYTYSEKPSVLVKQGETDVFWTELDLSLNVLVNNQFRDTSIFYENGRLGIGRSPLFSYKIDIAVEKNSTLTALHIGDGKYGFSMGNGTARGFVPEIIGVGSDETDAGLYFVGIAGNDASSDIPLIVLDGRNMYSSRLTNRPILGITSGNYNEYSMMIDISDNLIIKGNLVAPDIIVNSTSLLTMIQDLQRQINELKQT